MENFNEKALIEEDTNEIVKAINKTLSEDKKIKEYWELAKTIKEMLSEDEKKVDSYEDKKLFVEKVDYLLRMLSDGIVSLKFNNENTLSYTDGFLSCNINISKCNKNCTEIFKEILEWM